LLHVRIVGGVTGVVAVLAVAGHRAREVGLVFRLIQP
jgi:hypothetical protein